MEGIASSPTKPTSSIITPTIKPTMEAFSFREWNMKPPPPDMATQHTVTAFWWPSKLGYPQRITILRGNHESRQPRRSASAPSSNGGYASHPSAAPLLIHRRQRISDSALSSSLYIFQPVRNRFSSLSAFASLPSALASSKPISQHTCEAIHRTNGVFEPFTVNCSLNGASALSSYRNLKEFILLSNMTNRLLSQQEQIWSYWV